MRMGFRPWVIFVGVTLLVIPEVSGVDISTMLDDIYYRLTAYEKSSLYKGVRSYENYVTDSFNYLQGLQHGKSPNAEKLTDNSQAVNGISQLLNVANRQELFSFEAPNFKSYIEAHVEAVCSKPKTCDEISNGFTSDNDNSTFDLNIYRSITGICNNWDNPLYGSAFTHQERLERGKFGGHGVWESTATIQYDLSVDGRAFSTERIGAIPYFKNEPFIVKVKGNEPFYLAVYDNKGTEKDKETLMANGKIVVEGALFYVDYRGDETQCDYEFQVGGNEIVQTGGVCDENFKYKYYEYDFVIVFEPSSSTADSGIYTQGLDNSPDTTWDVQKFEADVFKRYWLNFLDDSTIQLSEGSEFRQSEVFVTQSIPTLNLNRAAIAISGGDNTVEFVARFVLELVTNAQQPTLDTYGVKTDLSHVPSVYRYLNAETFSVTRLGVSSEGLVSVNFHTIDGFVLSIDIAFQQQFVDVRVGTDPINTNFLLENLLEIPFETALGEEYKNQRALWFVTIDNGHIYFGSGNVVGKHPISVPAINFGNGFILDFISVGSTEEALWTFDIEKVNRPRVKSYSTGEPLPTALDVGMRIHTSASGTGTKWSDELTMTCFQWGQFVDHDIVATPLDSVEGHHPLCCVDFQVVSNDSFSDVACFNIPINETVLTDAELAPYSAATQECMAFSRSAHILDCTDNNADDRDRQQMNAITSFLDASNVYGSTKVEVEALKDHSDRALLEVIDEGNPAESELPLATVAGEACAITKANNRGCRHAGDFRSQENSGLNAMHTLWVREHNRIARKLRELFDEQNITPPSDDELFEWVRHIVAAENQVVNYREYIPSYVSGETISKYKLDYDKNCRYKKDFNPSILNAFGILYRLGHTWITDDLAGNPAETSPFGSEAISSLALAFNFFDPTPSFEIGSNGVMFNWNKKCAATDRVVERTVNTVLFANLGKGGLGANLAALNVQRGRDHGSPTYNQLRQLVNLETYSDLDELCDKQLEPDTCEAVKAVYHSIDDIDAFTAAMIEKPVAGSHVGEILNEVLGTMFQLMLQGDRFWYTCYFTKEAFEELQKVRIGKVLCDNVEGFDATDTQTDLFKIENAGNELISCNQREEMDLSKFVKDGGRNPNFGSQSATKKEEENTMKELLELLEEIEDKL